MASAATSNSILAKSASIPSPSHGVRFPTPHHHSSSPSTTTVSATPQIKQSITPSSRTVNADPSTTNAVGANQKALTKLPLCLKKLVRSVVRTFYSREHSLIVDMLVRNTIMKEDDLCERLRFEKKQLRQYLHTLKTDQFIKSKLQLETDADGKATKITHYFIEYQLFVNVVKYRLDQMQRRLEADQRQTTSRASFRCASCKITYTDLEVDRLISLDNPGRLECVYCRAEVTEQEDHVSRVDARALIAKFHQQVRDPIDVMLRACDEIHLSSSILEPEFRALESLNEDTASTDINSFASKRDRDANSTQSSDPKLMSLGQPESKIRIVFSGHQSSVPVKPRPVWMSSSTVTGDYSIGLDKLENGFGPHTGQQPATAKGSSSSTSLLTSSNITQTLNPGRVPHTFSSSNTNLNPANSSSSSHPGSKDRSVMDGATGSAGTSSSTDIMQLLLVHERRGTANYVLNKPTVPARTVAPKRTTSDKTNENKLEVEESNDDHFLVRIGDQSIPYTNISPAQIKLMIAQEKAEYIRIGKSIYRDVMSD